MADVAVDADSLVRQLEAARERERAVSRVLRAVARSEGLQPVLDEIVVSAKRLCRGEHSQLYLADGDVFRIVAQDAGLEAAYDYARERPHARDRTTVVGRVALSGDVEQIPDVLSDTDYAYGGQKIIGFRALLGVPITFEDDLIGAIAVGRDVPGPFSDDDVELVKTFAHQAAIAIANARLLETVERQLDQQRAIGDVLSAVARAEGLQPVLDQVVQSVTVLSGVENGRLWLVDSGLLHAFADYGSLADTFAYDKEHPHPIDATSMAGRTALSCALVHVPDVEDDPQYTYAGPRPYRAGLHVPILHEDELIGVVGITRQAPGRFTEQQIELVTTFADQAAIAIANARLVEAIQRQLEQQAAVETILRGVARSEPLNAVLRHVVESAKRLCAAEFGALYLADGGVFRFATGHEGEPDLERHDREHAHTPDRRSAIGRVALTRDVVHIPDVEVDAEYDWGGRGVAEYSTVLAAPILVDEELIGALDLARRTRNPFSGGEIQLLRTFADQAAIAVANARLIEAVERQRTELSRFVSPQVAELLSSDEGQKLLGGHRGYVTILFCDLRGFTTFTETAEPEELFEVLRDYHAALGELIPRYEGTLEHFQGDGLMVFFNDPAPVEDHELKAVQLALSAQERLSELAGGWRKRGVDLDLGIGIASGYATLGRVGFEGRYDYGALGSVTNLAARLTARASPGQTLISQRVYAAVEERVDAEPVGELELKGIARPVVAYEVRGLR